MLTVFLVTLGILYNVLKNYLLITFVKLDFAFVIFIEIINPSFREITFIFYFADCASSNIEENKRKPFVVSSNVSKPPL